MNVAPLSPPGADGAYDGPRRSKQIPVPGLAQPAEIKMNTMRIATPHGYSSRPPRRVWPIVLVVGLLLGLGGGAFAVAWFGRRPPGAGSGSAAVVTADARGGSGSDQHAVTAPPDAASADTAAVTDAASAAVTIDAAPAGLVKLTLDSQPRGATVFDPQGVALGKTPLKLDWPAGTAPVTFTLKLRGYRDKPAELTVTSNTMTRIDLDRLPHANPGRGSGKPDGDGLERPD